MQNSVEFQNRKLLNELADGFVVEVPQYEELLVEDWELDTKNSSVREIHFKGALFSYGDLPNFFSVSKWTHYDPNNPTDITRVSVCQNLTKAFKGNVYMDDVCVSDINLNERS